MSERVIEFIRACQRRAPCRLGGVAALAGIWLHHRLSRDIDLFCEEEEAHRDLVRALSAAAGEVGGQLRLVRDGGGHARARLVVGSEELDVDAVHDALPALDTSTEPVDGVAVESLVDLRASKITCLLSRMEPRDLVDVLFLERAGYPPEADLKIALQKAAGIDPGVLAWLLDQFTVEPLPSMLQPLQVSELRAYRDQLAARLKRIALEQ